MTKKEIVRAIATDMDLTQTIVMEVVEEVFDRIIAALETNGRIELRNFGVFEVKVSKPRQARNPRTSVPVAVPARAVVKFKPGREMAERVGRIPAVADGDVGPLQQ